MSKQNEKALLPAGLQDVLFPAAAHEADVTERLVHSFALAGYGRIKTPLLEFEKALLSGAGESLSQQIFRLMDPVSHHMMGLRADITPQVARVASTRLLNQPRPLRLCYAGEVLQVRGSQLRPERQFRQVGAELIGATQAEADAEVILQAVAALEGVGVKDLSVDINMPTLVSAVMAAEGIEGETAKSLREALDRKDAAEVAKLVDGSGRELFLALLKTAGPAESILAYAESLKLTGDARVALDRVAQVVALIRSVEPELSLTVDLVEHRGFEYHTGLSFIFFARSVRGELGRGGRYDSVAADETTESATGFTLYMDTVLRALPQPKQPRRIYLPYGTRHEDGVALRAQGWVTITGLKAEDDAREEARKQGCDRILVDGHVNEIGTEG
ncbi:ATP phosphoribosyltransferase regulatory subunit [Kiloniella sp. b19]|uniref:ATP phosphoribosyltransferase regulatory subunit n=1 Tax=Kiloniella sp. GXU_MW_B19 TaxID=3141326 RepID=UPI0031D8C40C